MRKNTTLSVKIPSGVENGERMRLLGQGHAGPLGGPRGHLYLHINVYSSSKATSTRHFRIHSSLVKAITFYVQFHYRCRRPFWELRFKCLQSKEKWKWRFLLVYIYTVSIIYIYIYIGTQCNSKLRLRGQGIYNNKTKQQGDEILSFNIQIPKYIRLSITANNIGTWLLSKRRLWWNMPRKKAIRLIFVPRTILVMCWLELRVIFIANRLNSLSCCLFV